MSSRFSVPSMAPRDTGATVVGIVLLVLVGMALGAVVLGFSLMILCGILWSEFGWLAPIGFAPAFGIGFFGSIILLTTRANVSAKSS